MSALTFTLKSTLTQRLDLSQLTPDILAGKSAAEIERFELRQGRERVALGDLFAVREGSADDIVIEAASDKLDWVGRGMTRGSLRVSGAVGAYAGAMMRGGALEVGGCGPFAACEMVAGTLTVQGDAGDFLGGARPGEMRGMRGGEVRVLGNAGARAGDRLRRGSILIAGSVGDYCASRMIAGTIAVLGAVGDGAGTLMTRGSLLLAQEPARWLPTFNECGTFDLSFLTLLARQWRGQPGPLAALGERGTRVARRMGDLGAGGKGEILVWR